MRREAKKLLEDAYQATLEVQLFVRDRTLTELKSDVSMQRSTERSLEIIGEALRRLRDQEPEIAQLVPRIHRIIGVRNNLAHGYDVLDYEIIWDIATGEVPELNTLLKGMLDGSDEPHFRTN